MLSVAPPSWMTLSTNRSLSLDVVKTALILTSSRSSTLFLFFHMKFFRALNLAACLVTFFNIFRSSVQPSFRIFSFRYLQLSHLGWTVFG
jgi:hypothetical protein